MPPADVIRHLAAASCTLRLLPDGRVRIRGPGNPPQPPPPHLLELVRLHRDAIAQLLDDSAQGRPEIEAPTPTAPRRYRPGVLPGDPPAPVVAAEATRCLVILELAGTAPRLGPDGRLELAHPERVTPDERAAARPHEADIAALLSYRALIEKLRPVTADPPRR